MGGIGFYIGGFGSSRIANQPFVDTYGKAAERMLIDVPSCRKGVPSTPLWGDPAITPLAIQAAHVADNVCRANNILNLEEVDIHLVAHSLGVPITALFAKRFAKRYNIASFTAICPAGVIPETAWTLIPRIGFMAARDVATSAAGRTYWLNSGKYVFGNPVRSLQEGACVARHDITPELLYDLRELGVPTKVFLAPDDDAFSYKKTREVLEPVTEVVTLPHGLRHGAPQKPGVLVEALRENGALYI